MGDSNQEWGELASQDSDLAAAWDECERLPDPGENEALDALCARKNLTINSLVKLGARLAGPEVLAFAYEGGIKYRDMVTDRRWSWTGTTWDALKIVRSGLEPTQAVIVAEGETDGARLSDVYTCDVAIMPAGARYFPPTYAAQLADYEQVLIGLDTDEAGEQGTAGISKLLPTAVRFAPPANDWCEATEFPPIPTQEEPEQLLVPAGALVELEPPDVVSWYEQAVLPVGGLMLIHGWAKSYKTFTALDMLAQLTQGQDWACLEPTEEPCKVAVIQYEITWPYYQARIKQLRQHAREPDLFDANFFTWQPLRRPDLVAGVKTQEDHVIQALVDGGIQVLLVDPIRRAIGAADLNAENEVRRVLGFFQRIQDQGITVVATHHDRKSGAGSGDPLSMTGSGAFAGDPDTVVSIELPHGDDFRTSTRRNLRFLLRNAPAIGGRGMEIQDDGRIIYDTQSFGDEDDPDAPAI